MLDSDKKHSVLRKWTPVWLWLPVGVMGFVFVSFAAATATESAPASHVQRSVHDGIVVDFSLEHLQPESRTPGVFTEGDDVRIIFSLSDEAAHAPLKSVYPAAWMDVRAEKEIPRPELCTQKAETFLSGSFFSKAELDLNVYYVLTLNDDATISVVDPLFGFGGSKLLTFISLPSAGKDWLLTEDQARLFVSMPDANQVAVIDTASWEVRANVDVGHQPTRLVRQPDEQYVWVATEGAADGTQQSGVTVLRTTDLDVVAHIPTGQGQHDIVLSTDNRFAFVSNSTAGTVSIIDVGSLRKVADIKTGANPQSLAFSSIAQTAYVAHQGDGSIVAIDPERREIVARMQAKAGLGQMKFAPGDRLGFALNPAHDEVSIFDVSTNRIVQTGDLEDQPDQISFSDQLAYVRHRGSEIVLMIPLAETGVEGRPVQVIDFPGGDNPPGRMSQPSPADAIVQAPGADAVLVANPQDESVYFYKEGMAAPMGNFSNYGKQPRAVIVVDRSLQDRSRPGAYETVARLRRPGLYDVVFFLDAPRIVHCFQVAVGVDPELERQRNEGLVDIQALVQQRVVSVGQNVTLQFKLTDKNTQAPKTDVEDVKILIYLAPGVWHTRQVAEPLSEGVYAADFILPRPGVYYAYVGSPSLGISFNNDQYVLLQATNQMNQAAAPVQAAHSK